MATSLLYVLDANVFIGAKNLHYGLDFCPAFWEWLIEQNGAARVFSIEKVGDEVQALADDLSVWARSMPYMSLVHRRFAIDMSLDEWLRVLTAELEKAGALRREGAMLYNI